MFFQTKSLFEFEIVLLLHFTEIILTLPKKNTMHAKAVGTSFVQYMCTLHQSISIHVIFLNK
jgi:hypothetical protein